MDLNKEFEERIKVMRWKSWYNDEECRIGEKKSRIIRRNSSNWNNEFKELINTTNLNIELKWRIKNWSLSTLKN